MLNADGPTIDYQETGDGPAVLFLPGSFSTPAAWRGVQTRLPQNYRFVGTSLLGYGGTQETRTLDDPAITHQIRMLEAVARRIDAPFHLVAHSFGGAVALTTALANVADIKSIATFEASPGFLLRDHGAIYDEILGVSENFEAAVRAGDRDAAKQIIDYWGGGGSFDAMPDSAQDYCRATASSNVLDWWSVKTTHINPEDLAQLNIPVLAVRGGLANPAMVAITDVLTGNLPDVHRATVDGASHFLITTHADDCARLLEDFLAEVTA